MSAAGSVPSCVDILVQPEAGAGRVQKDRGALSVLVIAGGHAPPAFEPADTAALCAWYRFEARNGNGNGGLNVPLRQLGVKGVAVGGSDGKQAGQGYLLHQGLTRSVAPSGSALLSPRPYRDINAHAVDFMTIYQGMWMFDFSQIQASAKLQRT